MKKKADGLDLVTKEYLDFTLSTRFDDFEEKMRILFTENNSVIFTRIDPLLSELEDKRLDREITTQKLEELDARVTKLENS